MAEAQVTYKVKPTAEVKPPARAIQATDAPPTDKPLAQAQPQPYPYYSDIAMTNLFNGYLSLLNFERQALWQRYQAMLIGNSIILSIISGFLTKPPADSKPLIALTEREVYAALAFGFSLCIVWPVMTIIAWTAYDDLVKGGKQFSWHGLGGPSTDSFQSINPLQTYISRWKLWLVRGMAFFVILLFIAFYIYLLNRYRHM